MGNTSLTSAKKAKNDEFYTQYSDIEKEINVYLDYDAHAFRGKTILLPCDDPEWSNFTKYFVQNFERLGIKKLISTSYVNASLPGHGKIYTLTCDTAGDEHIDFKCLEWGYLNGDGDFRSDEIKKLRDESDIIITNPPFSLFREFILWASVESKSIVLIGNMNAITYKELFPFIKSNKLWLGATNFNKGMYFRVPDSFIYTDTYKFEREQNGEKVSRVPGVCWFTNIDHGKRHEIVPLMTKNDNLKFNKKIIQSQHSYKKYDNYDAIEIPFASGIPSDYDGVMGIPISFLDKYNPNQFEIVGATESEGKGFAGELWDGSSRITQATVGGERVYKRLFIRKVRDITL